MLENGRGTVDGGKWTAACGKCYTGVGGGWTVDGGKGGTLGIGR